MKNSKTLLFFTVLAATYLIFSAVCSIGCGCSFIESLTCAGVIVSMFTAGWAPATICVIAAK